MDETHGDSEDHQEGLDDFIVSDDQEPSNEEETSEEPTLMMTSSSHKRLRRKRSPTHIDNTSKVDVDEPKRPRKRPILSNAIISSSSSSNDSDHEPITHSDP
jgi:hypothetical protein